MSGIDRIHMIGVNMNTKKTYEFTAAICGYQYYKRFWQPRESEQLVFRHYIDNPFDVFAIKTTKGDDVIVDHLPHEISGLQNFCLTNML